MHARANGAIGSNSSKIAAAVAPRSLTSQLPIEHWHDMIGDATFGDAILDRVVHHSHRLTLTGGSLRRLASADTPPAPTDSLIPWRPLTR